MISSHRLNPTPGLEPRWERRLNKKQDKTKDLFCYDKKEETDC